MGIFDIIFLCFVAIAAIIGFKRGGIRQIAIFIAIYLGFTLSLLHCSDFAAWIESKITIAHKWSTVVAFILIFAGAVLVFSILGHLLSKLMKITMLGWLDRLAGVVLGAGIFLMVASVLVYFVNVANEQFGMIPQTKLNTLRFYEPLLSFSKTVFPILKSLL